MFRMNSSSNTKLVRCVFETQHAREKVRSIMLPDSLLVSRKQPDTLEPLLLMGLLLYYHQSKQKSSFEVFAEDTHEAVCEKLPPQLVDFLNLMKELTEAGSCVHPEFVNAVTTAVQLATKSGARMGRAHGCESEEAETQPELIFKMEIASNKNATPLLPVRPPPPLPAAPRMSLFSQEKPTAPAAPSHEEPKPSMNPLVRLEFRARLQRSELVSRSSLQKACSGIVNDREILFYEGEQSFLSDEHVVDELLEFLTTGKCYALVEDLCEILYALSKTGMDIAGKKMVELIIDRSCVDDIAELQQWENLFAYHKIDTKKWVTGLIEEQFARANSKKLAKSLDAMSNSLLNCIRRKEIQPLLQDNCAYNEQLDIKLSNLIYSFVAMNETAVICQ